MGGWPFARGTQTMNSMFFKPMVRKTYHKRSSASPDMIRETTVKLEAEEVKNKSSVGESTDGNYVWVPHERTGIYYPKGQEKVMEDVPPVATKDFGVNWFSYNEDL
ncbi:hypothetical protein F2P56_033442 [Juglans regia]|uniref:Uncharacterized protein LOC108996246 n=2 Tax=Juglans regia TaxID=51240 RepID=A0A2I4F7D3_JUGRE|nr:uncharacterized protein LOC108996246 [Juglans regia]KAF5447928.1 hypothetical protein F2P56_033442 [Juglans regia]